jgi:hypothetical protein
MPQLPYTSLSQLSVEKIEVPSYLNGDKLRELALFTLGSALSLDDIKFGIPTKLWNDPVAIVGLVVVLCVHKV